MKQLLVGSVYAPSPRNEVWYKLQLRYLDKTIGPDNYTHVVWANRVPHDLFKRSVVLGGSEATFTSTWSEHADSLTKLLEHFATDEGYDHYLFLDSDAFPCRDQWLEKLMGAMQEDDLLPERKWASAVRFENFDFFPHPCVLFIKGQFLRSLSEPCRYFNFAPKTFMNLMGYQFEDVGCGLPTTFNNKQIWLPLLRSNHWNPHPILAALYGSLFYHHGAGSRPLDVRGIFLRGYDHYIPRYIHAEVDGGIFNEINLNPEIFIRQLMG